MPPRPNLRAPRRRTRRSRRRRTPTALWRFTRRRWRELRQIARTVLASPPTLRIAVLLAGILLLWLGVNWAYQASKKPAEVLFPLDHSLNKSPAETWQEYGALFRQHSTTVITPAFLAALAQVEGAGNPVARTGWQWHFSWNPLEWYQPASSAVGMFQITDGTFEEAKRYCIRDHRRVEDGPWHDLRSCWFNRLYTRVLPSHAIEMTAALLDRRIAQTLEGRRKGSVTLKQKHDLAAIIHLCGVGAGRDFVRRGFRLKLHQRCGDHDGRTYLTRVNMLTEQFTKLTAAGIDR